MLQWMGGSRRKVTTSRRSTQKRQKQYFEQRKRQQQQEKTVSDGYADGISLGRQHQKEHRSLDILSLLNLSAISKECRSSFPDGGDDEEANPSEMKSHMPKGPPTIIPNAVTPAYFVAVNEARTASSGYQEETTSPKKNVCSAPHDHASSGSNNKSDFLNLASEQQLSIFDLLGDDGLDGHLGGNLSHEAHVSFSVEGLGKVGTETPAQSPKQHGSGCTLAWKDASRLISSKNFNYMMGDLEAEVEAMIQDNDMPVSGSSWEFPKEVTHTHSKLKQKISTVAEHMQPDGHKCKIDSPFGDTNIFNNIKNGKDTWDDAEFLYGRERTGYAEFLSEDDTSWKSWVYQIDGVSADFLKYGNNEVPDYAFDGSPILKKRNYMKSTKLTTSEPPSLKHQKPDIDHSFTNACGVRRHPVETNFDFRDIACQPGWPYFVAEDAEESLSMLSESCSSTAVNGKTTNSSFPNSTSRQNRGIGNTFGSPGKSFSVGDVFEEETHCRNWNDNQQGKCGSGKCTRIPPKLKTTKRLSSHFLDQPGTAQSWLFEKGCNTDDINSDFSYFCGATERKLPSVRPKLWTEDPIIVSPVSSPVPELNLEAKPSFDRFKHSESVQPSPFGNFTMENFASYQPFDRVNSCDSSIHSKVRCASIRKDSFPFPGLEEVSPDSSHASSHHGETAFPDLLVPGSVSEDESKSKSQSANTGHFVKDPNEVDAWNNQKKGVKFKEAKDDTLKLKESLKRVNSPENAEETSSSVEISDKPDGSAYEKRYNHDAEAPLPCQNESEGREDAKFEETKNIAERHSTCANSSKQVMMLESYVFQLLCVQKVLKQASALDTKKV